MHYIANIIKIMFFIRENLNILNNYSLKKIKELNNFWEIMLKLIWQLIQYLQTHHGGRGGGVLIGFT